MHTFEQACVGHTFTMNLSLNRNSGTVTRCCRHGFTWLVGYFSSHKTCLNCLILTLAVAALAMIRLLLIVSSDFQRISMLYKNTSAATGSVKKLPVWHYNNYGFHPVNEKGVYSFWNVCIEARSEFIQRETDFLGQKIRFQETKQIVIYNSFYRDGVQKVYVAGSHNSPWNQWDIRFSRNPIPSTHAFHNTTAFFVVQTCPVNFHHFWIDEFVPLFCVIKKANRLQPGSRNQIIYRLPTNLTKDSICGCYNKTTFEEVLFSLYTTTFHDVFYHMNTNTCYSSGVFGISAVIDSPRIIVEHTLKYMNISVHQEEGYVTIIQRNFRRIININELMQAINSLGFRNMRVVNLETMGVVEQAKIAASSRVMIGVQGAGLQWAVFMPPGSSLIEIAWPYKHWGFYFNSYVTQYQIIHHQLYAQHVRVNWSSYEHMVRHGNPVSMEERIELLQSRPKTSSLDNIWKWGDAIVNKDDLISILSTVDFTIPQTRDIVIESEVSVKNQLKFWNSSFG